MSDGASNRESRPETAESRAAPRPSSPGKPPRTRSEEALDRFHEERDIRNVYDARTARRLWPFLKPHARPLVLSIVLLCANSGLALLRPLIMRSGFDAIGSPDALAELTRSGLLLSTIILAEQAIAFPQMFLMQVAGARAMADLRAQVFDFLHSRSLSFFDRTPVGRLVTRVTNDVDAIGEMFGSGALNAIGDLLRLVAIVAILLSLDVKMSLFAFAALPVVAIGVYWTRGRIRGAFREVRAKTARMNAYLNEQVSGMGIVQAYAREHAAAGEFDKINDAYRRANNQSISYDAAMDAAIEMVSSLCIASVLWYIGVTTHSGDVSFGTLFAFVAYIDMFFVPIRDLSSRFSLVQAAMTGAERVFDLLDNKDADAPAGAEAAAGPRVTRTDGPAFELEHVSFEYKPGVPVLKDVTIHGARGEKIALVGATGAGKSTVASLLLRLYDATSGVVRVEGADVKSLPREELRAKFAVVPQDVFLFPGTIVTNVAAGAPAPDEARVRTALQRIGALELFERRSGGIHAVVNERGSNFSAGERQLLAFARALYRDPPMFVLDEATANVDSDTEARLQRALEGAMHGRTALIIAHRLSTIRAADRIVVFHKGRVVEVGTHEELLVRGGVYAKLHRLHFAKAPASTRTPLLAGGVLAGGELAGGELAGGELAGGEPTEASADSA